MSYTDKEKNAEYARNWYARNRERLLADPLRKEKGKKAAAEWRSNNREKAILSAAKARAKRLGYDFNLELEDIVIPDSCPILGLPLLFIDGAQHDGTPALDRRDNSKGYVKGNCFVISHKANRHKADMSPEQLRKLADYVERK